MNRSMNVMTVQRILQEFERESSAMDMKDDIMNDTIEDAIGADDDALGDEIGENEESDAILREVLDEIGVNVSQQDDLRETIAFMDSLLIRLIGIATASFASGLGEITYLQYATPNAHGTQEALMGSQDEINEEESRNQKVSLSLSHKMRLLKPMLIPYVLPLTCVYFAEYTINQGVSPTLFKHALLSLVLKNLQDYYPLYQLTYQTFESIARSLVIVLVAVEGLAGGSA
ncbi:battenin CLN3 protein [Malassezia equina]|uniref:Battenin CLN3 protein n=1 Tax=Malassezia equina TaxID=1381935 RepID=A0AAF0J3Y7_9BASI|nr:battenin CLN3 protein [Malassezia equina]